MKLHQCRQGSAQWLQLRAGIPCSSDFHRIITPSGKPSSQQEAYKFTLLAERILGRPLIEHVSWAMERGSNLEQKAVEYLEFQLDAQTEEVGFITDDDERWGTSPDRLLGDEELLEIKCPDVPRHMMNLMNQGAALKEYAIQTAGQLWITGRQRAWLCSYHPDLPIALYPIERDETFITLLSAEVVKFSAALESLCREAKDRGYFRLSSIREPQESEQDIQIKILKRSLAEAK